MNLQGRYGQIGLAMACLSSFALTSCGETENKDIFHLYVVNGYAGGGEITIYSDIGPLVSNLGFGETSEKITVDRSRFSGNLEVSITGASELSTISIDPFAFYPSETATLFMKRRSGASGFEFQVMRHHKLTEGSAQRAQLPPSYACATQLYNGLSLTNEFTDNRFDLQTQWNFSATALQEYGIYRTAPVGGLTPEENVVTTCGDLNLRTLPELRINGVNFIDIRASQMQGMMSDPWYFLVSAPDEDGSGSLTWRWGIWDDTQGTSISGIRSTDEYRECVAEAIEIKSDDTGAGGIGGGAGGEDEECAVDANGNQSIPLDANGFPQVTVDAVQIADCLGFVRYEGISLQANSEESYTIYSRPTGTIAPTRPGEPAVLPADRTCNYTLRLRTRLIDGVYVNTPASGQPGSPSPTPETMQPYPSFNINYPVYHWQHVMIYGRPIDPFVYQITSGEKSEDFRTVDYPNGQVYGDDPTSLAPKQ